MNVYFNQTDRYLLLAYYLFAVFIGFFMERYSGANTIEIIFNLLVYVFCSFSLFWILIVIIFPKYLPNGKFVHILISLLVSFLFFGLLEFALYDIWDYLKDGKFNPDSSWIINKPVSYILLNALSGSFLNIAVLFALYSGKRYFETNLILEAEAQKSKELQFRALKTQMDPHFLFNNLNSIESLIEDEPDKAILYVQKLSKLYRYFLKTNNEEVVTIEDELNFANDYIYLINARFGNLYEFEFINFKLNMDKLIPPCSLQCVIENVMKHNMVSAHERLTTTITLDNDQVIVKNPKKLKTRNSNRGIGTGLANLEDRYKLLGEYSIEIEDTPHHFTVILPLINEIKE